MAAPKQQHRDLVDDTEDYAREGLPEIQKFFADPSAQQRDKADAALSMLGHYASLRSTRARETATLVAMAKLMNLKGEALTPVFEQLTGRSVTPFLPEKTSE